MKKLLMQMAGGGALALAFGLVSAGGAAASDGNEDYKKDCDRGKVEQRDWNHADKAKWHHWKQGEHKYQMVNYRHDKDCDPKVTYAKYEAKHDNWSKDRDCD